MSLSPDFQDFLDSVVPLGRAAPVLLLYGARPSGAEPLQTPPLPAGLAPETLKRFTLQDEGWPWAVDLFELHLSAGSAERFSGDPAGLERDLREACESLISRGARAAWMMFDGAFEDPRALFSDWHARNTYAAAAPGVAAGSAVGADARSSAEWLRFLSGVAARTFTR